VHGYSPLQAGVRLLPYTATMMIVASVRDANLRTSLDEYIRYRRQPLQTVLGRGLQRGELSDDADVEVLIDALISPVVQLAGRLVVGCRDGQRLPDIDRPTRRHSVRLS